VSGYRYKGSIMPHPSTSTASRRAAETKPLVSIVEDDTDVRRSIARLLQTIGLETEQFANASQALSAMRPDRPGCLIVDMRLPDRDGLDLIQDLRREGIKRPAIVITAYADVPAAVRALKLEVFDFFEKPFPDQQFLAAVQQAIDRDLEQFETDTHRMAMDAKIDALSQREQQVLRGIIAGSSSKMIAADLGISPKTVENYRASLMDKLDAENVAHLVTLVYDVLRDK